LSFIGASIARPKGVHSGYDASARALHLAIVQR
jgi:hypothetical protein